MKIPKSTWVIVLIFRLITSLLIKNVLIPDEVYQSVEISTTLNGGLGYLTWEWKYHLRSYLLPLIFSQIFSLSEYLGLTEYKLIISRLLMGLILAATDYLTVQLGTKWFGDEIQQYWVLVASVFNFGHFILGYRWLANSFEMFGLLASLYLWPVTPTAITSKNLKLTRLLAGLLIGGLVCILRPTSGLIYLFLGAYLLVKCNTLKLKLFVLSFSSILVILVISLMVYLDTSYYGELTFVPLEFLKFNVFKGISSYYGVHNLFWYFYSALPTLLISWLPLTILGYYSNYKNYYIKFSLGLSTVIIGIFSLLPHKEFRFIYPLLPLQVIISALTLHHIAKQYPQHFIKIFLALMLTNLLPGIYINQYHHCATLPIMNYLQTQVDSNLVKSIGFLMPCHSTPFYSHLQRDIPMWFLTCNPNLDHNPDYLDSENQFYKDPIGFIDTKFVQTPTKHIMKMDAGEDFEYYWPNYLVVFDHLLNLEVNNSKFEDYLKGIGYEKDKVFWNSHFSEPRRAGDLVVLKK